MYAWGPKAREYSLGLCRERHWYQGMALDVRRHTTWLIDAMTFFPLPYTFFFFKIQAFCWHFACNMGFLLTLCRLCPWGLWLWSLTQTTSQHLTGPMATSCRIVECKKSYGRHFFRSFFIRYCKDGGTLGQDCDPGPGTLRIDASEPKRCPNRQLRSGDPLWTQGPGMAPRAILQGIRFLFGPGDDPTRRARKPKLQAEPKHKKLAALKNSGIV